MKSLICFCALILVMSSAAPAHAYRINVLDPPISYTSVPSEPFAVTFMPCPTNAANGCFYGQNDTLSPLTTLEVYFPNTGVLAHQAPTCPTLTNPLSIFHSTSCAVQGGYQIVFFQTGTIGTIPPSSDFIIQIEGLTVTDSNGNPVFPTGGAYSPTTLSTPPTVPEPNSIVLLSTALLIGGFFFVKKRNLIQSPVNANR